MSDPVNAQHMAAMGLSERPLGRVYATNRDLDRCTAVAEETGERCARSRNHDGKHARGTHTWQEVEVVPRMLERACDEAKSEHSHDAHEYTVGEVSYHCDGYWPTEQTEPTKQRPGDQALPNPGRVCVQDLVIEAMEESKRVGVERYGSTLQTFNGRRGIQDVAEEVRDLFVYLTQVKAESEADRETLVSVVEDATRLYFSHGSHVSGHHRAAAEAAVDAIMGWIVGNKERNT